MRERIAPSEKNQQALRAAEFLYYDAHRLLEIDPEHQGAAKVKELMEPIIVGEAAGVAAQVILNELITRFDTAETIRSSEQEIRSIYIATIGLDSVGKAEVTSHLREKYGFEAHPLSDRLIDIGYALGHQPPFDREKLRGISEYIKGLLGKEVLIRFAEALFAEADKPNRVLFDGIRVPEEVIKLVAKEFNSALQAIVIAIQTGEETEEADLQERFSRSLKRGSEKDPKEFEIFKERSLKEAPGILESMKLAHLTVFNRRNQQEEMLSQIDEYLALQRVAPLN